MRSHSTLFALTSILAAACATSPTDDTGGGRGGGGKADGVESSCPVDGDGAAILEAIENGGNCYTAAGLAEACAFGASIDVQFVSAATGVCARGFDAMPASARADYDRLIDRCGTKYENETGSMYRSMASFCQLEVTTLFNTLYPEPATSEPAVGFTTSCPVDESDPGAITAAIDGAGSCYAASNIAEACAWGSSIDMQFVASAGAVCADGLAAMTAADNTLRDKLGASCETRFADEGGTLGRSMTAYCTLQVNVMFDSLYALVE